MPTCRDVMTTSPVCCEPDDPVTRAADLMKAHDVGSLPVVEPGGGGRLVGIVTDRDLVVKVVAGNRAVESATVRDAMTANPSSCQDDQPVERALAIMAEQQVRRLPVVDASGRLVGIIAQADIATRMAGDQVTGELVEAISEPPVVRK